MAAAIRVTLMRRVTAITAPMIRYLGTIGEVLTLANGLAARGHTGVHGAEKQDRAAS
jgi:hypothetical protein